jgi:DNA repair exonuclease SbcCD ATPase subunit
MCRRRLMRSLAIGVGVAGAAGFAAATRAEVPKPEAGLSAGAGAVARILPPEQKVRLLEEDLAKETERRVKAEEESARHAGENKELSAKASAAARERTALDVALAEAREREGQLQKMNDRLRAENERIAVTVRLSLPVITILAIAILAVLFYTLHFLRKVATRIHGQRTLAEMHETEARLAHVTDQYNAEVKRNQTLRHKLADLGIVD